VVSRSIFNGAFIWRSPLGPVRRGRSCQHFAKITNIQQASGLGHVRPQHRRSRINIPMSSLGPSYTPRCPKTPPISHQDLPQTHRDPPRLQRDRGRHPPRLRQDIILSFGTSQPGVSPCVKTRFSYVQCLRRKGLDAPEASAKPFPGDLIPKNRLVRPRTPPEILPRSRTIRDCPETPLNVPRLTEDLPRFQDCQKTPPSLRPPRNSQLWTHQAPSRISPRARAMMPPRSRKISVEGHLA
jgi:hypothetical protein